MNYRALHSWDVIPEEARQLQNELRTQVIQTDQFGTINTVAGVDIGLKKDTRNRIRGRPQFPRTASGR